MIIYEGQGACTEQGLKTIDEEKICRAALVAYGDYAQMDMMIEECSELIKEICKMKRCTGDKEDIAEEILKVEKRIAEEIADVLIMIRQMEMLFGIKDEVEEQKAFKLERLKNRLEIMEAKIE